MTESKSFLKFDIGIAVAYLAHSVYYMTKINASYSSDYQSILVFYVVFNLIAIGIQALLIVLSLKSKKQWLISIRFLALSYLVSMLLIFFYIGLLSVFFILLFCAAAALHVIMLLQTVKLPRERRLL